MTLYSATLSESQFDKICKVVYDISGIKLQKGKEELVKSRLIKRLKIHGFNTFSEYLNFLECDDTNEELAFMIDAITTNKTDFFREIQHFDYLKNDILPKLIKTQKIRIWSAGCSSGEEPFTIAILLNEEIENIKLMDVKILASDISINMINKCREGLYNKETLKNIPTQYLKKYFHPYHNDPDAIFYNVDDKIKSLITFAKLNLLTQWPMKGPFDLIFCRNVMIYFDKITQEGLVNRFYELLPTGGHLFVGHSESLISITHKFKFVKPAIYIKE